MGVHRLGNGVLPVVCGLALDSGVCGGFYRRACRLWQGVLNRLHKAAQVAFPWAFAGVALGNGDGAGLGLGGPAFGQPVQVAVQVAAFAEGDCRFLRLGD